ELSKGDPLIHRNVANAINGLTDFLELERKRVPRDVLREAERLECLLFGEYDPHFEGDEPPGCEGELGAVALIAGPIGIGWSVCAAHGFQIPARHWRNLARLWASRLGMVNATPLIVTYVHFFFKYTRFHGLGLQ